MRANFRDNTMLPAIGEALTLTLPDGAETIELPWPAGSAPIDSRGRPDIMIRPPQRFPDRVPRDVVHV